MYSNNYGVASNTAIGGHTITGTANSTNPGWKLTIGNNFGVTSDGAIYASKGKIGAMSIDALASIPARNLALNSQGPFGLDLAIDKSSESLRLKLAKPLSNNTQYTLSFNLTQFLGNELNLYSIRFYHKEPDGDPISISEAKFDITEIKIGQQSFTFMIDNDTIPENVAECELRIALRRKTEGDQTQMIAKMVFNEIKLEQGSISTPWCSAEEDAVY
jgi:hypothetical protein